MLVKIQPEFCASRERQERPDDCSATNGAEDVSEPVAPVSCSNDLNINT